ncbi:hypothetical protein DF947_00880 [Pedobacter paludis]|uniref:Uncharacterized protein n=1 Tax=Pedobacter paludis TaxID=2203212 RepID=A0A317F1U3_9SPHI|nr:hypothetical protein DF947_00880 [Pedobacter paludis]
MQVLLLFRLSEMSRGDQGFNFHVMRDLINQEELGSIPSAKLSMNFRLRKRALAEPASQKSRSVLMKNVDSKFSRI